MKHIQLISCQDHLPSMAHIPTQYLLVDGEEVEVEGNIGLITAIFGELSDEDIDCDGYLRSGALEVINTLLDPGHENFDPDWYDTISAAI